MVEFSGSLRSWVNYEGNMGGVKTCEGGMRKCVGVWEGVGNEGEIWEGVGGGVEECMG